MLLYVRYDGRALRASCEGCMYLRCWVTFVEFRLAATAAATATARSAAAAATTAAVSAAAAATAVHANMNATIATGALIREMQLHSPKLKISPK